MLGERLSLGPDPKNNTLVQKSWLYCQDPALAYKINGVPKAAPVTDRSITLPTELAGGKSQFQWNNPRKAILTGKARRTTPISLDYH